MCPENMTNLEDGSYQCNVPVRPGTNLSMRYAVIVSFGVYLNGTSLEAIASKVSSALMVPKVLTLKACHSTVQPHSFEGKCRTVQIYVCLLLYGDTDLLGVLTEERNACI